MNTNSFIFTDDDSLSLCIANKPYSIDSSNPNWDDVIAALKQGNFDVIPGLINRSQAIKEYVEQTASTGYANIVVNAEYGTITYYGQPVSSVIVDHIFRMRDEGFDINPMLRFLDNLLSNPSKRAVDELYGFMQYGKMPVTEDGCFLAYKRVRDDYKSVHDGKTDNSIGTIVQMPRNQVNENSNETCSTGLHFCSFEYLKHFSGAKIVVLKVNPRDVVSIPNDYNNTKGRACRYEVIGELSQEEFDKALKGNIFKEAVRGSSGEKVAPVAKPTGGVQAASAKVGPASSPFYQGYTAGYGDGSKGNEFSDECGYACGTNEEIAYQEGYVKGYDHAEDGVPPRYVIERAQQTTVATPPQVKLGSSSFFVGYRDGYNDGRLRGAYGFGKQDFDSSDPHAANYHEGYDKGYNDGANGKPQRYDVGLTAKSNLTAASAAAKTLYDAGYSAGSCQIPAARPYDEVYMLGYNDAKAGLPHVHADLS